MHPSREYILEHFDEALERGYIKAFFQPVYRAFTEKICDAESLARWEDPTLGVFSPLDFIPVLEEDKQLVHRLDLAILERACGFYQRLCRRGTPLHSFSVNLSRLDFQVKDFFNRFTGIVRKYGVPTEAVKIEITESIMLKDASRFDRVFNQFHDAGFDIWIDDFGSGYSSLKVLKNYDFDMLKIDMDFLKDFDARSKHVISSIINMAKSLGIHTLAEGIENERHLNFLKNVGCECIQGYYYSRPLDERTFEALIAGHPDLMEPTAEKDYWNAIGRFNLLATNPLDDYSADRHMADVVTAASLSGQPLALIELRNHAAHYVYASRAYLQRIQTLGYQSLDDLEHAFNDRISPRYGLLRNLVVNALERNTIQEIDYINDDACFRLRARCIAKAGEKAMLAMSLRIFDSEHEALGSDEVMRFSRSLFATYEHVDVLYPGKDTSKKVYSTEGFEGAHQRTTLRTGIHEFAETELHPDDRARYLRFFNLDTLAGRIAGGENAFIQQAFRIRDAQSGFKWRAVRITRIPSDVEELYLFTMQQMSERDIRIAETLMSEHPELLEDR